MVVRRGDIWWADLPDPTGRGPGYRRPVIVVQSDYLNRAEISSVIVVPLTSNVRHGDARAHILLGREVTGLPSDSVALVTQLLSVDRGALHQKVSRLTYQHMLLLQDRLCVVLQIEDR